MNKKFRTLTGIILIFIMCFSMCSCGKNDRGNKDKTTIHPTTEDTTETDVSDTPIGEIVSGKRNIIIDTDTGGDDAAAIILAALDPDINIVGVTTVFGNVELEQGVKNALMALEVAGCKAPVFLGSEENYEGENKEAYSVYGEDGMGDADLVHPTGEAADGDAIDFIINTVKAHPGEIEIVALGPVTNIAYAIEEDPEAMKNVKRIWSMGTAGLGVGNSSPVAEFNVAKDAESYSIMLSSGLPVTIVGLDVTEGEAEWSDKEFDELAKQGDKGAFVAALFGKIREFYKGNGKDSVNITDPVAMMCALYPDFVKNTISTYASCITEEGETFGEVIFYKEGFTYDMTENDFEYTTDLVTEVDAASFFDRYVAVINGETYSSGSGGNGNGSGNGSGSNEKNGDIYILFTSDVHCAVDEGFGYAGVKAIRDKLDKEGYTTILVDDGDFLQGEPIGTLSKGEAIIELMNDLKYDVAIPGNHEFDYGMDNFLELAKKADFPIISCNFNKDGELIFEPYIIKEAAGFKIAFVGVTTPMTLRTSSPVNFQNEKGEYIYGFMQDKDGSSLYNAVQKAVDDARTEGADFVYLMAHLGKDADASPWTFTEVVENTTGIDAVIDGHSHDTELILLKNKNGEELERSAPGTKLDAIGYSHISADGEIVDTDIWSWPNDTSLEGLIEVDNEISVKVDEAKHKLDEELNTVVAHTDVDLVKDDPEAVDESGNPVRIIRVKETNLGDLCADAYRDQAGADIAFINGGGIRDSIKAGDITYNDIIKIHPFGNELCVLSVTGQQILDALEWGSKNAPEEFGGFLQVSGLSYEIDVNIESTCTEDEYGMFAGVSGERRVKNVMVGDEPVDPDKTYTLAGHSFMLLYYGDGYSMFEGSEILQDKVKLDNQVLIDYIIDTLGGTVGDEYKDPYGQGRIKITE